MALGEPITSDNYVGAMTGSASTELAVFVAPMKCVVESIHLTDITGITAHTQNYATVTITNKGQAGTGTTVVATRSTDTATTDTITAFKEWPVTLSDDEEDLVLEAGDVLALKLTEAGTGQDLGGACVSVHYVPGTGAGNN